MNTTKNPTTSIEPIFHVQESFSKLNADSPPKPSIHLNNIHLRQHAASSAVTITLIIGALLIWKFRTKLYNLIRCGHAPREPDSELNSMPQELQPSRLSWFPTTVFFFWLSHSPLAPHLAQKKIIQNGVNIQDGDFTFSHQSV
jgi:hypothetical protein